MEYLSTAQVAERLGISRTRVLVLIYQGRLPALKVGRDWMILSKDLEEFAKQPRLEGWRRGRARKPPIV